MQNTRAEAAPPIRTNRRATVIYLSGYSSRVEMIPSLGKFPDFVAEYKGLDTF